jgi:putative membrane protein
MMGGFGGFGAYGWIGMILNLVLTLAMIGGLIYLIIWAVRRSSGSSASAGTFQSGSPTAKEIAQARYAKGEISREEYQQILSDLSR